jgi:hypothetical protein
VVQVSRKLFHKSQPVHLDILPWLVNFAVCYRP